MNAIMHKESLIFCSLLILGYVIGEPDPCKTASIIANVDMRLKVYKINPLRDKPLCDRYYIKNPGEWFRTVDGNEMVNKKTKYWECGTHYGLYMKGDIPNVADGTVTRTAHLPGSFTKTYDIKVKNCGTYTVYYLKRPDSCDEAYCFGYGEMGTPPNETTNKPTVSFDLQKRITADVTYQQLAFKCNFMKKTDTSLKYKVFWYINNHNSPLFASKTVPWANIKETFLNDESGLKKIKLGVQISCIVKLYYNPKGPPGPPSEKSELFFAGVQLMKSSYNIDRDGHGNISFRLTVPFGCEYSGNSIIPCDLNVELTSPIGSKCSQAITALDECGISIPHTQWKDMQNITVRHKDDGNYDLIRNFEIYMKTNVRRGGKEYWDDIQVPPIHIHALEGAVNWKGKHCSAVSDPHMHSFDQIKFESQEPGTYTLYKHVMDGNVMELQHKVTSCYLYKGHMNQCTCAIAARAASDVFVIDRCPGRNPWYFGFRSCVQNILEVKKFVNDEFKYEIQFPTGTHVRLNLADYSSDGFTNKNVFEVYVYPSKNDESVSQGLCSRLGSQKLLTPDGSNKTDPRFHYSFTQSWRVKDKDNLIEMSDANVHMFPIFRNSKTLCICDENARKDRDADILNEFLCTNADKLRVECEREKDKAPLQKDICFESRLRRSISTIKHFSFIPNNYVPPEEHRVKRSITTPTVDPLAISSPRLWCERFMNKSAGFLACTKIPNSNPQSAIDICVLDIQSTNTTIFATAPREGMKTTCLKEVDKNNTLRNTTESDGQTIAEKIVSVACPNECSGNGKCDNGTCICNKDFGAGDCSVNINVPPTVFAINYATGGLCDKKTCKKASVEGDLFLNRPELMCRMQRFEIDKNGTIKEKDINYISGEHNSIADIRCPFPHTLSKRSAGETSNSFITGYHISVSNNGKDYSSQHMIYILDSTCQDTQNVSGKLRFILRDGYCFIYGRCIANGERSGCNKCDILTNPFRWTYMESEQGCHRNKTEKSKLWIIGVVLGVLCLSIISVAGVFIIKKKKRVVFDSSQIHPPPYEESSPSSIK